MAAVRPVASDQTVADRAFSESGDRVDQATGIRRDANAVVVQDFDIVDFKVHGLTLQPDPAFPAILLRAVRNPDMRRVDDYAGVGEIELVEVEGESVSVWALTLSFAPSALMSRAR